MTAIEPIGTAGSLLAVNLSFLFRSRSKRSWKNGTVRRRLDL